MCHILKASSVVYNAAFFCVSPSRRDVHTYRSINVHRCSMHVQYCSVVRVSLSASNYQNLPVRVTLAHDDAHVFRIDESFGCTV